MRERALKLFQEGQHGDALTLFRSVIEANPNDWNCIYLAGQCCRSLNDIDGAIKYLLEATGINPNEPPMWLALGIAYQLKENWGDAIGALREALEIDPDYVLAFNSLALTQKKMGELEKSAHNYDAGVIALSRSIVESMINAFDNQIFSHRGSTNNLWMEYATHAAVHLATSDGNIESIAMPTGETAVEEDRTHRHGGLYWVDQKGADENLNRYFLPNFFNAFHRSLRRERLYSQLIANRGAVLELMGNSEESQSHFQEAEDFSS
jgi:tetratricopeptide (TPR) repeat protein